MRRAALIKISQLKLFCFFSIYVVSLLKHSLPLYHYGEETHTIKIEVGIAQNHSIIFDKFQSLNHIKLVKNKQMDLSSNVLNNCNDSDNVSANAGSFGSELNSAAK